MLVRYELPVHHRVALHLEYPVIEMVHSFLRMLVNTVEYVVLICLQFPHWTLRMASDSVGYAFWIHVRA